MISRLTLALTVLIAAGALLCWVIIPVKEPTQQATNAENAERLDTVSTAGLTSGADRLRNLLEEQARQTAPDASGPPDTQANTSGHSHAVILQQLDETLSWEDIDATLKSAGRASQLRPFLLNAAPQSSNPAVRYLAAMLYLAQDEPEAAVPLLKSIPAEAIPGELLYAPYRLSVTIPEAVVPGLRQRLLQLINAGRISALTSARVCAMEGLPAQALQYYLQSAPTGWTSHDAQLLTSLQQHAGYSRETREIMAAAVRGGFLSDRVEQQLRMSLDAALSAAQTQQRAEALLHTARTDADARRLLLTSARDQLRLRQMFAERRYQDLLDEFRDHNPPDLTDETVYLLTLAAATTRNIAEAERWGREMLRRDSDPAVMGWLDAVRSEMKADASPLSAGAS